MKATQQGSSLMHWVTVHKAVAVSCVPVVLFTVLYTVVLTFMSRHDTLQYDHFNQAINKSFFCELYKGILQFESVCENQKYDANEAPEGYYPCNNVYLAHQGCSNSSVCGSEDS